VRRECLDHLLILQEKQLSRVLHAYVAYSNRARPHQGLKQHVPDPRPSSLHAEARDGPLKAVPILGGLHMIAAEPPEQLNLRRTPEQHINTEHTAEAW
jgi:hypothetical protein